MNIASVFRPFSVEFNWETVTQFPATHGHLLFFAGYLCGISETGHAGESIWIVGQLDLLEASIEKYICCCCVVDFACILLLP